MYKFSYNVIFVYGLLVVDLIINITDHLLTTTATNQTSIVQSDFNQRGEINSIAFIVVIIQIFAIFCVVIDLVLHFFQVADQVRQFAWVQLCQDRRVASSETINKSQRLIESPMPQRIALELVLKKYWWSLLVGLLYLVLSIILHIIRLDPIWHYRGSVNNGKLLSLLDAESSTNNLRMATNELIINSEMASKDESLAREATRGIEMFSSLNQNLLPVIVLLLHKLMSTCYYVSFVVVYRATPSQMVNRIFVNKQTTNTVTATTLPYHRASFVLNQSALGTK